MPRASVEGPWRDTTKDNIREDHEMTDRDSAVPDEKWRVYTLYESGNGRRYGLLF
jgi:hypothetical protein